MNFQFQNIALFESHKETYGNADLIKKSHN